MLIRLFILTAATICFTITPYDAKSQEQYGRTFNIGVGLGGHSGYSDYVNRALPVFTLNYEIDVVSNFTIAPSVSVYGYSNNYIWNNRNFRYRETVIPIGVKGTYYVDEFLGAGNKWDFYLGSSIGFAIVSSNWEQGYDGDRKYFNNKVPVFIAIHFGAEYHLTDRLGMFLDISSGFSTFGISIHN